MPFHPHNQAMTQTYSHWHDQRENYHQRMDALAGATNLSLSSDLTARNSLASPLLRLPAEIRQAIWEYAYGDIVVHVRERYTPTCGSHNVDTAKPFEYQFYATNPCWSSNFKASLQQLRRSTPLTATPFGTPAIAECPNCCMTHSADHSHPQLPLVSRQFWHEALSSFLSALTLSFSCARVFYDWSRLEQRLAKQVRGLEIRMTRLSDWRADYPHWALVLHDETLAVFEKLRGVRLLVQIGHDDAHRLRDDYDVMNSAMWSATKFPGIVRAFQRHRLDRDLTCVALLMPKVPHTLVNYARLSENPDRKLADAVRRALLDHHPPQPLYVVGGEQGAVRENAPDGLDL